MQRKALKQVGGRGVEEALTLAQQGHAVDQRKGVHAEMRCSDVSQVFSSERTELGSEFEAFEQEIEPLKVGVER